MTQVTDTTRRPWLWALPIIGFLLAWTVGPSEDGPTLCPFALITGVACPGCGLTRAAGWLARGDVMLSLSYHPLVLVVAAWMAGAWGVAVARRGGKDIQLPASLVNRLLLATALLFVVTWLVRLATGTLPPV